MVGLRDARWSEAVTAVVPRGEVAEEELTTHAWERSTPFEAPKRIVFVPELARNASGRILKRELRERFAGAAPDARIGRLSVGRETIPAMADHSSVVRAAWSRIDTWLEAHAPRTFAGLSPPADPADVERAQREMGLRFPQDLLDSLACHDGAEGWTSLTAQPPLSVAGIVELRRRGMALLEWSERQGHPVDGDGPDWHPLWLPWAESDGDVQVVDLRPGEMYGQVGTVHHDEGGLQDTWPSLGAYLTEVADVLEHGGTVGLAAPYLTPDGELRWELPQHVRTEDGLTPAPRARTDRTEDLR